MGIVISLVLIAFGAILAWAVNSNGGSVDPQVVGVILMVLGFVVFLISLVLWRTWWGAGFWGPYDEPVPAQGVSARPMSRKSRLHRPGLRPRRRQSTTEGVSRG
jgi:hypothetical protein